MRYALDGGVYAAASAVNWARGLGLFDAFETVSALSGPPAIERGVAFVPALAGLGCPHWNRQARGSWLGLSLADGRDDLLKALLEGIALRTAEVLSAMAALHPFQGPRRGRWRPVAERLFHRHPRAGCRTGLFLPDESEQTAAGLARMAAEGLGLDWPEPRPGRLVSAAQPARTDWRARFAAARAAVEGYAATGG